MSDRLLPLYDQELAFLRNLAGEFADAHPKIAGRLRLSADAVDDPHVARLMEGFALVAARIRQKLDDEFPELTESMLGVLYPQMLAPFPSAAIVGFAPSPEIDGAYVIRRHTAVEMEPVDGESCRYRTTQDVTLWPIAVRRIELSGQPLVAPDNPAASGAASALRVVLECLDPKQTFFGLGLDCLRFHLGGPVQHGAALYEQLCNHLVGVALADHPEDPSAVFLGPSVVSPVGFAEDEALLPTSPRSFDGYRLLDEYFGFPAKFMFFDLAGISAKSLLAAGPRLEVFFYFDRAVPGLERHITLDSLQLGCSPIVNLFSQRAEPIALTHERAEYLVLPDTRRHATREVFAITDVSLGEPGRDSRMVLPFFASHHAADPERQRLFWTSQRRRLGETNDSTDVTLSIVDADLGPASPTDGVLSVEITCLNRDLPRRIPFGANRPGVTVVDGATEVAGVRCLTPPTPTLRPPPARRAGWWLISQLSLNHLSLTGGAAAADALREILRLHDVSDTPETRAVLEAMRSVHSTRASARLPGSGAICRGVDVAIELDTARLEGSGVYLFASILDRFLALYASMNSFSRLQVRLAGRADAVTRFPPRAGDRPLL